jgi:hypothetical protein
VAGRNRRNPSHCLSTIRLAGWTPGRPADRRLALRPGHRPGHPPGRPTRRPSGPPPGPRPGRLSAHLIDHQIGRRMTRTHPRLTVNRPHPMTARTTPGCPTMRATRATNPACHPAQGSISWWNCC